MIIIPLTEDDKEKEIALGFNVDFQTWFIINNVTGDHYDLSLEKNLVKFLEILRQSPLDIVTKIQESIKNEQLLNVAMKTFPLKRVIFFIVNNKMFFWLEEAIKWIEYIKIDNELKELINKIKNDKDFPQHIRHKLVKSISLKYNKQ